MTLIRWKPVRSDMTPYANWLDSRTSVNRMLENFFGHFDNEDSMIWGPNVDIAENENEFEIHAELPGVKPEDVQISLNDNVLTLSGEKKQEVKEEKGTVHRIERSYGKFQRSFSLPSSVAVDKVRATFEDGVLRVALPTAEHAKPRSIQIETNKK